MIILGMGPRLRRDEDFFGVYDGHGGFDTAKYLCMHLHKTLSKHLTEEDMSVALQRSFAEMNAVLHKKITDDSGATAVIAYIQDNIAYFANCGDARAVIGRRDGTAIRCSVDHKPEIPEERQRIEDLGGLVLLYRGTYRVNARLAVARAFGDKSLYPYIIADPYLHTKVLDNDDLFLILACDGIWDEVKDEEAVNIVYESESPEEAAQKLVDVAYERHSTDNMSVIVVFLQDKPW